MPFSKPWNSIWRIYIVLRKDAVIILQPKAMKKFTNRLVLFVALSLGSILGMLKGQEARQKWVFRVKSRLDEKRQSEEQKKLYKNGAVALDDIELASYHKI